MRLWRDGDEDREGDGEGEALRYTCAGGLNRGASMVGLRLAISMGSSDAIAHVRCLVITADGVGMSSR